jgi:hypothetical protein
MNRKHQLTYCKVCLNKEKDLNKGVICKLTGEVATFQETCPYFSLDEKLSKQLQKTSKIFVNEKKIHIKSQLKWLFILLNTIISVIAFLSFNIGSEFATALSDLGRKVLVILAFIGTTGLFYLITSIVEKNNNIFEKKLIFYSIVFAILIGMNAYFQYSIFDESEPTTNQYIRKSKRRINEDKRKAISLLKKATIYKPQKAIVIKDSLHIVNGVKEILLSLEYAKQDNKIDSVNLVHLGEVFAFVNPKMSYVDLVKINSIECSFIMYSPDCKFLIALLTFQHKEPNHYGDSFDGILLFVEKKDDKLYCYPYTNSLNQYSIYSRDGVVFNTIASYFDHIGVYDLKDNIYTNHCSLLSNEFWKSDFFFSTIKIGDRKYPRYQTILKYDNSLKKTVYKRRHLLIIE